MKIKRVMKIICLILYLFLLILMFFSLFINKQFNNISFEQLLYNIIDTKGANYDIVITGFIFVFSRVFLVILVTYIIFKIYNIKIKSKLTKYRIFKRTIFKEIILLIIFLIFSLSYSSNLLNLNEFINNQTSLSSLFEEHYVDGREIDLKFPKKKRNLIYVFLESMEATNFSKENGGVIEKTYIPKLEHLALNNISFSNTNKLGGALQVNNTTWTTSALIAHTSGVPLKISSHSNDLYTLPGVYSLGDILEDNGYNNYIMFGSDATFGGRKDYFESHGNYKIYDYYYAIEDKQIPEDYYVWWGYEDKKLFEYAKEKILEASSKDEPFNFTLLTVDTHFTDGYMDSDCKKIFDEEYANSIYCSDTKINSFIKWIQKQDFYKNTTIILSGDHLTMQKDFYNIDSDYQRTIYNAFINSPIKPKKEKNRLYSSFDMFPTTLASLGVQIENNRLGLGVNLFSKEKTLIEKLGYENLNNEIVKKSNYYDNKLLKAKE